MADYLQGLILVAAGCGLAAHADSFSHRKHLAMKLACAKCHAAAQASTRASDNLLPTAAACAECHRDSRTPRGEPTPVVVSRFNHALHAKLGNVAPVIAAAIDKGTYLANPGGMRRFLSSTNACEACHRGLGASDAVTKAAFPRMADCLVCHKRIDPPDSCAKCHLPGPWLRPATHTADFVDVHSNRRLKMDTSGCAACHGRDFTCQGCH